MEANRLSIAIIYLATGIFFTYVAIQSVENSVWDITTIILILVATLSFGASIRYIWRHIRGRMNKR